MRPADVVRFLFYRDEEPGAFIRFLLFAVAAVLGSIAVFGFALFHLSRGNPTTGAVALATSIAMVALYGVALRIRRRREVYFFGALLMEAYLVYLITSVGAVSMLFWLFTIPVISVLMLGATLGTVSSLLTLAGAVLAVVRVGDFGVLGTGAFTWVDLVRFVVAYLLCAAFALNYEIARERRSREARERQIELADALNRVERMSVTDALTGLNNRLYFNENMPREIATARRYGLDLSLVICDIDHFKAVNDAYGHQVGDVVLQEVSQILTDSVRQDVDWVSRCGGEEFVIVLPRTAEPAAVVLCERIRRRFEIGGFSTPKGEVQVTMSFGVAELWPDCLGVDDFFVRTDERLYRAKGRGRNAVVGGTTEG